MKYINNDKIYINQEWYYTIKLEYDRLKIYAQKLAYKYCVFIPFFQETKHLF